MDEVDDAVLVQESLQRASGEPAGAVGDTFVIHMDRESLGDLPMGKYDVTVTILERTVRVAP